MSNQKDSGLGEQNRQSDKCRTCGCWMPIHHFSDVDNISGKRLAKCVECQLKARIDGAFRNRKSLARTDIAKLCIGCLKSYEKWYDTVKKLDKQKRNEKHENNARKVILKHHKLSDFVGTILYDHESANDIVKRFSDNGDDEIVRACQGELSPKKKPPSITPQKRPASPPRSPSLPSPPPTNEKKVKTGTIKRTGQIEVAKNDGHNTINAPTAVMMEDWHSERSPTVGHAIGFSSKYPDLAIRSDTLYDENINSGIDAGVDEAIDILSHDSVPSQRVPQRSACIGTNASESARSDSFNNREAEPQNNRGAFLQHLQELQNLIEEVKTAVTHVPVDVAQIYLHIREHRCKGSISKDWLQEVKAQAEYLIELDKIQSEKEFARKKRQ